MSDKKSKSKSKEKADKPPKESKSKKSKEDKSDAKQKKSVDKGSKKDSKSKKDDGKKSKVSKSEVNQSQADISFFKPLLFQQPVNIDDSYNFYNIDYVNTTKKRTMFFVKSVSKQVVRAV